MSKKSAVKQKLDNIESVQQKCYEELNQHGIELSRESTFEDFAAHVSQSDRELYGLSIIHSYDRYYFYTMHKGKEVQVILYVEWKSGKNVENFDPNLHEWRIYYSSNNIPKIKTFKDLIKTIKS